MLTQHRLSLRDTADVLELGSVRLLRLGRYLHMTPGDKCIPVAVIIRAKGEADAEQRYRVVLKWLLEHVQSNGAAGNGTSHMVDRGRMPAESVDGHDTSG